MDGLARLQNRLEPCIHRSCFHRCSQRAFSRRIATFAVATEKIAAQGSVSIQGTSRKQNEDRLTINVGCVKLCTIPGPRFLDLDYTSLNSCEKTVLGVVQVDGDDYAYAGVFDGHGRSFAAWS